MFNPYKNVFRLISFLISFYSFLLGTLIHMLSNKHINLISVISSRKAVDTDVYICLLVSALRVSLVPLIKLVLKFEAVYCFHFLL